MLYFKALTSNQLLGEEEEEEGGKDESHWKVNPALSFFSKQSIEKGCFLEKLTRTLGTWKKGTETKSRLPSSPL